MSSLGLSSPGGPGRTFDPGVLDRLRLALRDESGAFAARVIQTFLRQGDELLLELERAVRAEDVTAASEAAHKLRGSSGTVGGVELGRLCDEIEHWQGSAPELHPVVESTRDELRTLTAALASYL
jgi:HPt (histidine-containing phosphotransfer) domain-containing protein